MAFKINTGLGKIYYSIGTGIGNEELTYGAVKELNELIEIGVSPTEDSASIWQGDREAFIENTLSSIDVTFTISNMTDEQICDLFGYKLAVEGGVIYDNKAVRPWIAIMFEQNSTNGIVDYVTLYKGKLSLNDLKGKTKEGKTEFQNKQFSGKFVAPNNGVWRWINSTDSVGFDATTWATKWGKTVIKPTVKPAV